MTNQIIKMLCFDATEPVTATATAAATATTAIYSNLRQWLNSPAGAGQWYTARHSADQNAGLLPRLEQRQPVQWPRRFF